MLSCVGTVVAAIVVSGAKESCRRSWNAKVRCEFCVKSSGDASVWGALTLAEPKTLAWLGHDVNQLEHLMVMAERVYWLTTEAQIVKMRLNIFLVLRWIL